MPDGSALVVAGPDKNLRRWLIPEGRFAPETAALPAVGASVMVSARGDSLAVVSSGVIRWDTWANFTHAKTTPEPESAVRAAALAPAGDSILVATADGKLQWWDRSQTMLKRELPAFPATSLAWHPQGKAALLGYADGRAVLLVFDGQWRVAHEWKHAAAVTGVAWGRDAELAAVACADGLLFLRRALDGQVLAAFPAHPAGSVALAASRTGDWLLTGGTDRTAKLWHAKTGQPLAVLPQPAAVVAVGLSDNGMAATRDGRGTVRLWDLPAGPEQVLAWTTVEPLAKPVIRADGQFVYAIVGEPAVRVQRWNLAKGDAEQWLPAKETPPARPVGVGANGRIVLARLPEGQELEVGLFADSHRQAGPKHEAPVRTAPFVPAAPKF